MGESNNPNADGDFTNYLYFNFNDGQLKFNYNWVNNVNKQWGAGSGFLPEFLEGSSSKIGLFFFP